MPTGVATLDKATRGGLRSGGLVLCGGAPGSGKTSWLVDLAVGYARAGHPVVVLAIDEAAGGILIRIGQLLGLTRSALERGDRDVRDELAARLDDLAIVIIDQDEDVGATVESAAAHLGGMSAALGKAGVLVVDSVQKARCLASDDADGLRARISAVVESLKTASKTHDVLVLATSEMSRATYRHKRPSENGEALAGFKESGSLEYAATLALSLSSIDDEHVLVEIAKNRLGPRPSFTLRLDRHRASFTEVPSDDALRQRQAAKVEGIAVRLVQLLAEKPEGIVGQRALLALVGGHGADAHAAVRALVDSKRIVGGGRGVPYRVAETAQAAE